MHAVLSADSSDAASFVLLQVPTLRSQQPHTPVHHVQHNLLLSLLKVAACYLWQLPDSSGPLEVVHAAAAGRRHQLQPGLCAVAPR
jgi:hypothetical protein